MNRSIVVLTILLVVVGFSVQAQAEGIYSIGNSESMYTNYMPDGMKFEWVVRPDGEMVVYDIFWSESFIQLDNYNCTKNLQKISELEHVKTTGYYLIQVDSLSRSILEVPAELYQNTVIEFESGLIYVSNLRTRWYQAVYQCDPNVGPPPSPPDQMLVDRFNLNDPHGQFIIDLLIGSEGYK